MLAKVTVISHERVFGATALQYGWLSGVFSTMSSYLAVKYVSFPLLRQKVDQLIPLDSSPV